jgi:hypothetical protein
LHVSSSDTGSSAKTNRAGLRPPGSLGKKPEPRARGDAHVRLWDLATLSVDGHESVYLGDRLGSVAALTDEQTVVDESYRYDPYGALLGPEKSDG